MSAVIHSFPVADPDDRVGHDTPSDDLVAELARAVDRDGGLARAVGHDDVRTVATAAGPARLVAIRPDRQGGSNDLVEVAPVSQRTRTRRLVVAGVTVALALVLALFAGLGGAFADGDLDVAGTTTLDAGETLWEVADQITPPGGDVRPNLEAIMQVNDFTSAILPAGTLVRLPSVE